MIKITLTDADKGTGTFSITLNVKSNIPAKVISFTVTINHCVSNNVMMSPTI